MRSALAVAATATMLLTACSGSGSDAGSQTATSGAAATSATTTKTQGSSSTPTSTTSKGSATSGSAATTSTPTVVPNPTGNGTATSIAGTPGSGCIPSRVDVPSVSISEPVVAMGTNSQGQIYPPKKTTMWYDKSPQPGTNGVSVIAGHVEYYGPDDFYNLDRVGIGSSVTIRCNNGRVLSWKVREKQSVLKTDLQTDQRVWGGSTTPVVALITCDRNSRVVNGHHLNNYVVWAVPA